VDGECSICSAEVRTVFGSGCAEGGGTIRRSGFPVAGSLRRQGAGGAPLADLARFCHDSFQKERAALMSETFSSCRSFRDVGGLVVVWDVPNVMKSGGQPVENLNFSTAIFVPFFRRMGYRPPRNFHLARARSHVTADVLAPIRGLFCQFKT